MTDATDLLPDFDERWTEHLGVRIRTWERGEGPLLLLIHGFGGAAWNFSELAPLLPGRRVLIPDLPGHGASTPLPASASLAGYADALAETLPGPVDVLGHSLGGVVALRLAERRPELVRSIVLAAAAGISSSTRSAEVTITLVGLLQPGRIAGRRAGRIARSRRLRRLVFGGFEVANPDLLTERAGPRVLHGTTLHTDTIGAGRALVRDDPRQELDRVRCPVLVLWGARDRQVPVSDGFGYGTRLRAPIRVIADCGHLLISERPDVCARATLELVARV